MINFNQNQEKQFNELLNKALENAQTFNQHKNQSKMKQRKQYKVRIYKEHNDGEIVAILHRDFPSVYNQILEYLDNS